jgi:RimJ/RimL family protein N-acetyltransferase
MTQFVGKDMKLVENIPLDTQIVADLITDPDDLHLVWPQARWPFDHVQWQEVLDPDGGNKPFLVYDGSQLIGHAVLRRTDELQVYKISFLYLLPQLRSKGLGEELMALLEQYAKKRLSAEKLILVTRTYNPAAIRCYTKCGFHEYNRRGTLIEMSKVLQ